MNELISLNKTKPTKALIAALLCLVLSYFYSCMFLPEYSYSQGTVLIDFPDIRFCLFAVLIGIVAVTEILNAGKQPSVESFVWLACFAVCTVSCAFEISRVWDSFQTLLFTHIFCVYWVISRSGSLTAGESSRYFIIDAFNAYVAFPVVHCLDWIKTVIVSVREFRARRKNKLTKDGWWIFAALAVCTGLFAASSVLLGNADRGFGALLDKVFYFDIDFRLDQMIVARLFMSVFVCAWLFGLMHGCAVTERTELENKQSSWDGFLQKLRRIPEFFWTLVIGAFSILYIAFFVMQGTYLFGAFAGKLPEGFIVSQYAREGFFELCKVIAVNFSLLWIVTRMAVSSAAENKGFKISCIVLLSESMLFAVVAFSKLAMYIDIFGFTPLRLQSTWLVCVLFAACGCWMYSIITGKKAVKPLMYFGALSLCALCFV